MTFKNINGRPIGTEETTDGVVHYTCNPPNQEVLEEHGIIELGEKFDIGNNEVLLIPVVLFEEHGKRIDTIEAENLLTQLSRR